MSRALSILALVLGLLSSGCTLIGLGIGAAVPRYSSGDASPTAAAPSDAPVVTESGGKARARFDTPADAGDIKRAVCGLTPIRGTPVAATIEEGGARTACGLDDASSRHLSVRLKTYGAFSVVVEDPVGDQALVVEASKQLQQHLTPHESRKHRAGSYWDVGLGVGLAVDVVLVVTGIVLGVAMHDYGSSWGAGFGSWSGGM